MTQRSIWKVYKIYIQNISNVEKLCIVIIVNQMHNCLVINYINHNKYNQVKSFCYVNVIPSLYQFVNFFLLFLAFQCFVYIYKFKYIYIYRSIYIYIFKYHLYIRRPSASLVSCHIESNDNRSSDIRIRIHIISIIIAIKPMPIFNCIFICYMYIFTIYN